MGGQNRNLIRDEQGVVPVRMKSAQLRRKRMRQILFTEALTNSRGYSVAHVLRVLGGRLR